jgi:hypothetical protein
MNKEQLREVIRNAVLKKIAESKSITDPKYGYTMPDDEGNVDKENPRYQLIGYGNMPKSNWKTKILRDIDGLKKLIEQENWAGASHVINKSSVLYNSINMMKELSAEDIKEQLTTTTSAQEEAARKKVDAAKKREDAAIEKKRKIDKQKADFDRRNYPTINKNARKSTAADIEVGKASEKTAEAEVELAKVQKNNG